MGRKNVINISDGNTGISIQAGDLDNVNVVAGNGEPINTGSGTQTNVTVVHECGDNCDGTTYIAGDNYGGISRSF